MTPIHLSGAFVERVGWLLVHSVWQFALIALAAMTLQRFMQRCSAAMRSWALLLALCGMMAAPAATWLMMPQANSSAMAGAERDGQTDVARLPDSNLESIPAPPIANAPPSGLNLAEQSTPPAKGVEPEDPPVESDSMARAYWSWLEHQLRPWLTSLVVIWCFGVLAFAGRPLLSWFRVRRLRTVGVAPVSEAIEKLLSRAAEGLGVWRAVRVLQSSLVQTAVVVGYFRPIILLPVSVIAGLSPAQLEAILAHELAHIRRHDYVVNLLQILVETLFFYHPAVWWLSHGIRCEREHCCDDIAAAVVGSKIEYGRALLALEQGRSATVLAIGAGGGSLLERIRRLLGLAPSNRLFSGGSIAVVGLLGVATIAIAVWAVSLAKEPERVKKEEAKKEGVVVKVPGSHTHDVALSADGKMLARAGEGQIDGWDVASGKQLGTLTGQPHFYKVAFSPDGKSLASIGGDVEPGKYEVAVKLWEVATGKERALGKDQPIKALSLAFSPDSKTLATSYLEPAAVKLWDVATGKEKMELGGAWGSLAFSPDGKTLAVGDKSVQLWDLTTGKKRACLARHEDWLDVRPFAYSDVLAFSSDGTTMVSAGLHKGQDGHSARLTVWDVATAKERATFAIPGYSCPNAPPVVFTADGKTLITAVWIFEDDNNKNGRVSVQHFDLATGKAQATYWTPVYPGGDPALDAGNVAGFHFAALSADGKSVAWGGAEGEDKITGTAHVWEVGSLATSPPKIPKEIEEKNRAAEDQQKDIKELQGTWKLRAVETGGRRQDPRHLQTEMRIDHGTVLELETPSYQIDVGRRPKTIDIVLSWNPIISVKAIYLLEADRLTICRNTIDTDRRPTEFKTQPDDGLMLEIYERVTEREKAEDTFSLQMPAQAIFVKPGEKKAVTVGIRRGKKFDEDVALAFTDVPKGVTFEPAQPVSKHPSTQVEFTIQAARDAAVGDFAIKITGSTAGGHSNGNQLDLSVDPAGEAAREQTGKPPRRYLRPSRDPYTGGFDFSMAADETAHDGEVLTSTGGKLVMKSKDGTEHSYTLANNPQITYANARSSLEGLEPGMIVRVTAKKDKPSEATRIEAVISYDAFMAEYAEWDRQKTEREREKKEQQEIEHQKKVQQEIDHLQGTWLVVSSQTGDDKESEESLKKRRVIIKGDHLTLAFGNERNEKREGTFKVDPQKKSLDWVNPMAGDAPMQAIYEWKGDDLKIGFGVDGLLRPTRFEMGQDQVGWLLVLKRDREDAATTSDDPEVLTRAEDTVATTEEKLYPELIMRGHGSSVWRVCVSADGKRLVTCSGDRTLKLWDTHTGECLQVFKGHTDRALCAALSPDGKRMLSGGEDLTVRLWDAATGKELLKMTGHTAKLYFVAFLPEDQALSCSEDHAVRLWDLNTGKNIGAFAGQIDVVRSVASGDKARLAGTTSRDTSLRVRNVETGKVVCTIQNLGNDFQNVCISADGKRLLSAAPSAGSADENKVHISDAETGQELLRILAPNADLVAFSPDGKRIVTGMPLRVWDLATGMPLRTYAGHFDGVTGVRFLPDGKRVVSTSYDGTAHIWRARRTEDLNKLDLGQTEVTDADLAELEDQKQLTWLSLGSTQVTDAGLAELKDLKQLTYLDLSARQTHLQGRKDYSRAPCRSKC